VTAFAEPARPGLAKARIHICTAALACARARAIAHARVPLLAAAAIATLLGGCSYQMERVENPVKLPVAWDAAPVPDAAPAPGAAPTPGTASAPGAEATAVQPDWWRGFGSPVLEQLIDAALADNPTLKIAEERLRQAERALGTTRDSLLPELSVNAGSSRTRSGGSEQATTTRNATAASGELRYDLDIWGGDAARLRASKAALAGTRYDLDAARLTLSANVATQYFLLLSTRARVDIARENLAIAERLLRIVEARYRNGVARALDVSQQTTAVLQQRANLIPLEAQMRQTETALGLLLGQVPQEFQVAAEPFTQITVPEIAPWMPADLLLRRPDLAAAETDLAAARANIAVARANLLPGAITLTAAGGLASPDLLALADPTRSFAVSGVLSIAESIFGFRARRAQLADARSNEFITLQTYAASIRTALKQVDDGLANAQTDQRREEAQRTALEQAQRALSLAEIEYREGSGELQAVLEAQRTRFSAQDQLSQIRLARLNSALDLYVALGGGWSATVAPR
jgi:NodT family efflux transporter outer membrane factor (OMF) lipoprotein